MAVDESMVVDLNDESALVQKNGSSALLMFNDVRLTMLSSALPEGGG